LNEKQDDTKDEVMRQQLNDAGSSLDLSHDQSELREGER